VLGVSCHLCSEICPSGLCASLLSEEDSKNQQVGLETGRETLSRVD
jgi:formate hydrogenlyase subunit 6/NADH:ubiquinone oxidoreductase subunit I